MTTSTIPPDYAFDEVSYENDFVRSIPQDGFSEMLPNDFDTRPRTSKNGTYNIVSKDYGDHKVNYYIPKEYGDEYGISQLEDMSIVDEQPLRNPSGLMQRRVYQQQYDGYDYNDGYEYVEEMSGATPRTIVNVTPGHQRETQVITEIYEPPPPTETVEYIYEAQPEPAYEEEEVEYIIEEPIPQPIYVEKPRPVRRTVIIQQPAPPPPPPPPPARSPRRRIIIPRTPSPEPIRSSRRTLVLPKSPSPDPNKSGRRTLRFPRSPPISTLQTNRRRTEITESYTSRTARSPPVKPNPPKVYDQPPTLKEIVAQNRAKRGTRIPKPRREVYDDGPRDLPTYQRNIIKNGFMVHK